MTDDITRGLALLADEAEPAPIDSRDVITRARTRTRNRRATAAAFVTVALVGTLAVTVSKAGPSEPVATAAESREDRLTRLLVGAMADLVPSDWTPDTTVPSDGPPLTFRCDVDGGGELIAEPASGGETRISVGPTSPKGCFAHAAYNDGVGTMQFSFLVHKFDLDFDDACGEAPCTVWEGQVREELPDGTKVRATTLTEDSLSQAGVRDIQDVFAERPDGTQVSMSVVWPHGQRSQPPFTAEQLIQFATRFTF
jgi:hypothetical protein